MKREKFLYNVYRRSAYGFAFVGQTVAVSAKQAVNNVRHVREGDFTNNYGYGAVMACLDPNRTGANVVEYS